MKFEFFCYHRKTFQVFIEIATYNFFFSFTFFYLLFHHQRNQRQIRVPTRERNLSFFRAIKKEFSRTRNERLSFLLYLLFVYFLYFSFFCSSFFFRLRGGPFRSTSRLHDNALIKKRCRVAESTAVFRAMERNKISTLF